MLKGRLPTVWNSVRLLVFVQLVRKLHKPRGKYRGREGMKKGEEGKKKRLKNKKKQRKRKKKLKVPELDLNPGFPA